MHKDVQCGKRIVEMIMEKQASVYICGDGNAMGRDVQEAISNLLANDLLAKGKCLSLDEARARGIAHIIQMKTLGKLVLDIWS